VCRRIPTWRLPSRRHRRCLCPRSLQGRPQTGFRSSSAIWLRVARDRRLGKLFAIKIMHADLSSKPNTDSCALLGSFMEVC
jgi:hypothetical protein